MHKSNSEGFNAIQIITHFDNVPEPEKPAILKPKALGTWLNNIFRLYIDHTACMLTVLSHDTFCPLFLQYYITQYGEHTFFWTFAIKIVSLHLDFIWKPLPSFPFIKRTILTMVRFGLKSWTNSFYLANRFLIQKCKLSQKMTGGWYLTLMMVACSTHCTCYFSLGKRIIGSTANIRRQHGPYPMSSKSTAYQKSPHLTVQTIVYFNTITQDFWRSSLMKNTIKCLRVSVEIRTWCV